MAPAASSPRHRRPRVAVPPPPAPEPVGCPRCTRTCTVIRLTGQDGAALTLHSCHFCEYRWWTRHGEAEFEYGGEPLTAVEAQAAYPDSATLIGLTDVLAATRVDKAAKAAAAAAARPDSAA